MNNNRKQHKHYKYKESKTFVRDLAKRMSVIECVKISDYDFENIYCYSTTGRQLQQRYDALYNTSYRLYLLGR